MLYINLPLRKYQNPLCRFIVNNLVLFLLNINKFIPPYFRLPKNSYTSVSLHNENKNLLKEFVNHCPEKY